MRVKTNSTSAFGAVKTIRLGARFSVFGMVLLLSLLVLPVNNDKNVNAATGTAVSSNTSLTISNINDIASLDLTPNSVAGTFASSNVDGAAVFSVTTDNYAGYTLSIAASDDEGKLTNNDLANNVTYYIDSIDSATSASSFSSNTWGFKPSKYVDNNTVVDNTGNDAVFLPAPTTEATLLDRTTTSSNSNEYTISLGVKADFSTHAGSYSNTFTLITVANPTIVSISYNKNTEDNVTNMPANQTDEILTTNFTLRNNVPVREHYSFTGWCSTQPTTTNGTDTCSTTIYNPNGDGTNLSYGIDQTASNVATLYAMWQIDTFTQTTRYRYENANGTFGDWITAEEVVLNYGENYSWDQDDVTDFDARIFEDNGVAEYIVEDDNTNDITFMRQYYTCNKYYKKQKADGTYEDPVFDGSEQIKKGNWCTYTKSGEAGYEAVKKETMDPNYGDIINNTINYNRQTFTISFNKQGDITSVEGGGTYRWGEIVELTAVKPENSSCRTYGGTEWWTNNAPGGFVENNGATTASNLNVVHYEVGLGNALIGVLANHTDHKQTIRFSSPNGDTIKFDGTDYHDGDSTQVYCGTYNIVGTVTEQPEQDRIYLQDITPATCPTTKTKVYDRRDNESYYIQKLADGNCWLLDNLRLDSATTATLTTTNTNMSPVYNFTLPESWPINSGYSFAVSEEPRITTNFKNDGLAPWWQADKGTFGSDGYRLDTTYAVEGSTTIAFAEVSRVGVYYNYCAATAGTWCVDSDYNHPEGFVGDGKIYDICPAGWRMPTGGSGVGEYAELRAKYDTSDDFVDATNTRLASGMVNGVNTQWHVRGVGFYWSSSPYQNIYAYYLATWADGGSGDAFHGREVGHAVRCMMKTPTEP